MLRFRRTLLVLFLVIIFMCVACQQEEQDVIEQEPILEEVLDEDMPQTPASMDTDSDEMISEVEDEEELAEVSYQDRIKEFQENSDVIVVDLLDVMDGNSSGTGYILNMDGKLKHAVIAMLPPLEGDNFYEGWLVRRGPFSFFSTGKMIEVDEDIYALFYDEDMEYPEYLEVVITIETIDDLKPEVHILEGQANERI